jgi:hypothetical protein
MLEKKKFYSADLKLLKALRHIIVKCIVAIRSDSQNPFGSVDSKVQNICAVFENIVKLANKGNLF